MAVLNSLRYARTRVRQTRSGQRVRLVATITSGVGSVFNLTHPIGLYARVSERNAVPYFAWSSYPTPPFEHETAITGSECCASARFCWDSRHRIVLLSNDLGTIRERVSDDDGYTWNAEVNRFTGADYPDISIDPAGLILRAAYVAGAIQVTRQSPGDANPGSAFNAKNASAVDLSVENDSFRIVADARGFWWLHVRLSGAGATSLHYSSDDGATWTLTAGAVTGIASGTHPGMCAGADGSLYAWAYVGGALRMVRRFPGDTAWSSGVAVDDDAGADLAVRDVAHSMAVAYEGPRRIVLASVISAETVASDWHSGDDSSSFKRFV